MYTFDSNIVSDLYKEVYYGRPSSGWMQNWYSVSDDERQQIWDSLCDAHDYEMNRERIEQEAALKQFEAGIQQAKESGAGDTATAIRWMFEAEGFSLIDYQYGASYVCYHFGLSYQNPYVDLFNEVCHAKVCELWDYDKEAA